MKTKLLLLILLGIVLIIIGSFLIVGDKGSCPAQPPNPEGFSCSHVIFGFPPIYPTGYVSLFIGIILLVIAVVLSRKRRL